MHSEVKNKTARIRASTNIPLLSLRKSEQKKIKKAILRECAKKRCLLELKEDCSYQGEALNVPIAF